MGRNLNGHQGYEGGIWRQESGILRQETDVRDSTYTNRALAIVPMTTEESEMTKMKAKNPCAPVNDKLMEAVRGGFGAGQSSDGAANAPTNPPNGPNG
jgi:hypothetical protein